MTGGNLRGYRQRRWTPEELATLRARYLAGDAPSDIAEELKMTPKAVSAQAARLGLAAELEAARPGARRERMADGGRRAARLKAAAHVLAPEVAAELRRRVEAGEVLKVVARILGISPHKAKRNIDAMGVKARPGARCQWRAEDLAVLREGYLDGLPIADIAALLKEKPKVVARKAQTLRLHTIITPEALARREAARQAQARQGVRAKRAEVAALQAATRQSRDAQLRNLLIVQRVSYTAASEALGCSKSACQRAAKRLGLDRERDQLVERERREAIRIQAAALAERDAARRAEEAASAPRTVNDADLIAAAIAAGKVTIVPAAHAAGITAWEQATGCTARPPRAAIPTIASRRRAA